MFKNSNNRMSPLVVIGIIALLVVVVGSGILIYQNFLEFQSSNIEQKSAISKIKSISVQKPKIIILGENLSKVEIYFVPTGTEIDLETMSRKENAVKIFDNSNGQGWAYEYPKNLLITNIFAKGFDKNGKLVGKVDFPIIGASALADVLYGDWIVDKSNEYAFSYPKDFFNFDRYSTSNPGTSYTFDTNNYDFSKTCPNAKDGLDNLLKGEGLLDAFTYRPKESDVLVDRITKGSNNLCVYRYENDNEGTFCQVFITFIQNRKRIIIPRLINNGCTEYNINVLKGILANFEFTNS